MKRVLLLVAFVIFDAQLAFAQCSNTAVGSFTCIQSTSGQLASSATPTIAMGSNLTSGAIVVGGISWNSASATLNSISASSGCTGITWTLTDNPTRGLIQSVAGFYGTGGSGACTIQFNFSGVVVSSTGVHEVSCSGGCNATPVGARHTAATFDGAGPGTFSGGNITAAATDYIFGYWGAAGNADGATAGTGFTIRESGGGVTFSWNTEDKSASGANAVNFVDAGSNDYIGIAGIDITAAGGGGASTPNTLSILGVGPGQ